MKRLPKILRQHQRKLFFKSCGHAVIPENLIFNIVGIPICTLCNEIYILNRQSVVLAQLLKEGSGKSVARKLSKSWILSYLDYVKDLESPPAFKLWSAISAISSSLRNQVYMTRGFYKIFPNQYIVLIGPPGIGKGTAINPATALVKRAGTANYISDRITAEKILIKLEQGFQHNVIAPPIPGSTAQPQVQMTLGDKTATIISTELPIFLSTSEWMIPLMCEIWEKNEFSYDTKSKGTVSAKGLCVSLLGGCVPDYIRSLSKDSTAFITSGFSSRCIFVFANERGRPVSWPEPSSKLQQIEDDLVDDLKQIATLKGEFTFTKDAFKLWDQFYITSLKPHEFESDVVSNFKARMVSHVVKLSMCLSVSEKDDLIITKDNLYNSIAFIDGVKKHLDVAFRSIGESSLAAAQDRIIRYVNAKGMVSRAQIMKDNMRHITDDDLSKVLYILCYSGVIEEKQQGNKIMYAPVSQTPAAVLISTKGAGKP